MCREVNSISAIWKSSVKSSIEECAKLAFNFMNKLEELDESSFGTWFEKGRSKKEALKNQVEMNLGYFQQKLEEKYDEKFDDLGSKISFWTGKDNASSIRFNLGAYGENSFNKNSCVLNLPSGEYYESDEKIEILIEMITSYWKPNQVLINGEPLNSID